MRINFLRSKNSKRCFYLPQWHKQWTNRSFFCQDKEFLYYYHKHLKVRQKWINSAVFLISVARSAWATPSSHQAEREGWGYTLVMSQSITEHTPFTHSRTHILAQESLINQFLGEAPRGPGGNHTTQKAARIKSTCLKSRYGVVYKRDPVCKKPTFLEHELSDLSPHLCLLPFSAHSSS